jgi:hypothetical protein
MISTLATTDTSASGVYYSARAVANLQAPPPQLKSVFFNFDATLSSSDALSLEVLSRCGRTNATTGYGVTGVDLINAYKDIISETNLTFFKDLYWGGQGRIDTLIRAFQSLRSSTRGNVQILSASWAPIPEQEWAKYIFNITTFLGMGFDSAHVVGVAAPGPPIVPDKAGAIRAYLLSNGNQSTGGAVLVAGNIKYMPSILETGADFMLPAPHNGGIHGAGLNQLILKAEETPSSRPPKLSKGSVAAIVLGSLAVLVAGIFVVHLVCQSEQQKHSSANKHLEVSLLGGQLEA